MHLSKLVFFNKLIFSIFGTLHYLIQNLPTNEPLDMGYWDTEGAWFGYLAHICVRNLGDPRIRWDQLDMGGVLGL
jgi:hypothetical protein